MPTCEDLYHHPKRVILQHRGEDCDPWVPQEDHDNTMRAYLTASGRSLDELDQKNTSLTHPEESAARILPRSPGRGRYSVCILSIPLDQNTVIPNIYHTVVSENLANIYVVHSTGFGTQLKSRTFYKR